MRLIFTVRDALRKNRLVVRSVLLLQSIRASLRGRLVPFQREQRDVPPGKGVAFCLRFRDEARYLAEWLEYHRVAGVDHFFLYNNNSSDDYKTALAPFIARGHVTLIEWPYAPASPAAEEDCIRRTRGRFEWVGFTDADEFLIVHEGRSIGEFLASFEKEVPAVVLHWRFFGSSGHDRRPDKPVIVAYTYCQEGFNTHIKTFLRPERAAECRNPHSWFFTPWALAVDEMGQRSIGTVVEPPIGARAYLNHYYCKSREDYTLKMNRINTQDAVGIKFPTRTREKMESELSKFSEAQDQSAVQYYRERCACLGEEPILLAAAAGIEATS